MKGSGYSAGDVVAPRPAPRAATAAGCGRTTPSRISGSGSGVGSAKRPAGLSLEQSFLSGRSARPGRRAGELEPEGGGQLLPRGHVAWDREAALYAPREDAPAPPRRCCGQQTPAPGPALAEGVRHALGQEHPPAALDA